MKLAVCCICKNENAYLEQFVKYYKELDVDNIILYDNNDVDGEDINDSIKEYIDNGFVIVHDIKGQKVMQLPAYNNCLMNYYDKFDWIAFFDCDEYICFTKHKSFKDYILSFPTECDCIKVNWMFMTDSGLVHKDSRPLVERFTEHMPKYAFLGYDNISEHMHVKTIVKCGPNAKYLSFVNPHFCIGCHHMMNGNGGDANNTTWHTNDVYWDKAYLKHFCYKTIEEYLYNKFLKGAPDISDETFFNVRAKFNLFFKINERTPEKESVIEQFCKDYPQYIGH